ncbi:MAG: YesL family protein [Roseburia sp.]|nr:YesL family protein [Roseburia sp.]
MGRIFQMDSPIMTFLNKAGELILLDICWLIGCIPIVTIGTSTTALYYAVVKSVRKDTGYPVGEFIRAYRRNLKRGIAATLILMAFLAVLYINREVAANAGKAVGITGILIYDGIFAVLVGISVYLFPVLSRFSFRLADGFKLSFVMAVRYLPATACVAVGTALLFAVWAYCLPIPLILVLPAAWYYAVSFYMEKILLRYMPKPEEGEMSWYYL